MCTFYNYRRRNRVFNTHSFRRITNIDEMVNIKIGITNTWNYKITYINVPKILLLFTHKSSKSFFTECFSFLKTTNFSMLLLLLFQKSTRLHKFFPSKIPTKWFSIKLIASYNKIPLDN